MHKNQEKFIEYTAKIQIYICAFSKNFYNKKTNLPSMQIHMHVQETLDLIHPSINSRTPTCELISLPKHNTTVAENDDTLSSSLVKSPDCLFIACFTNKTINIYHDYLLFFSTSGKVTCSGCFNS